jgi:hypothetical protein
VNSIRFIIAWTVDSDLGRSIATLTQAAIWRERLLFQRELLLDCIWVQQESA